MVTACTGTFFSLEKGECARFKIPWSFQSGFGASVIWACLAADAALDLEARAASTPGAGKNEIAAAEIAAETKSLREKYFGSIMEFVPPCRTHNIPNRYVFCAFRPWRPSPPEPIPISARERENTQKCGFASG